MIDLQTLTDDQLADLARDVAIERERRQSLAQIPATVTQLGAEYAKSGGDPAELAEALLNTTP